MLSFGTASVLAETLHLAHRSGIGAARLGRVDVTYKDVAAMRLILAARRPAREFAPSRQTKRPAVGGPFVFWQDCHAACGVIRLRFSRKLFPKERAWRSPSPWSS
jgi:hypothetical protein